MDSHLARYVMAHFSQLMNAQETMAYRHLIGAMKAAHGRSDAAAQLEARTNKMFSQLLSDDPLVLQLARDGYEVFAERTAERIMAENGDRVFLNLCPRCSGLARTPTARQCRFCGLDWHQTPVPGPSL